MAGNTPVMGGSSDIDSVGQPVQPQYITLDQAKELAEEAATRAADQAFRRAQGLVDRRSQKIQETIEALQAQFAIQEQAGVQLTDEQKNKIAAHYLENLEVGYEEGGAPADDPNVDAVNQQAELMEQQAGTSIEEGDPEYQNVIMDGTPQEFLSTLQMALRTKAARLSSTPLAVRTPTNLGAYGARTNQIENIKDPSTLLSMGLAGGRKR